MYINVLLVSFLFISLVLSSWPMYQQNPQHTGLASINGPHTYSTKWTLNIPMFNSLCNPVIDSTSNTYLCSTTYTGVTAIIYSVDSSGKLKWQFSLNPTQGLVGYVLGLNDTTLFVVTGAGYIGQTNTLIALDTSNGKQKWIVDNYNPSGCCGLAYSPIVTSDGTILISLEVTGLIAIDGSTSKTKWVITSMGGYNWFLSIPGIGIDGNIILFGQNSSGQTAIHSYSLMTGNLLWSVMFPVDITTQIYNPTIGPDGMIYYSVLCAFYPNGTLKWDNSFYQKNYSFSDSAITNDGFLVARFAGPVSNFAPEGLSKFNAETGAAVWFFSETQTIAATQYPPPPVVGGDGIVYFGDDYLFYAVNPNGTLLWACNDREFSTITAIALNNDGTVVAGCDNSGYVGFGTTSTLS